MLRSGARLRFARQGTLDAESKSGSTQGRATFSLISKGCGLSSRGVRQQPPSSSSRRCAERLATRVLYLQPLVSRDLGVPASTLNMAAARGLLLAASTLGLATAAHVVRDAAHNTGLHRALLASGADLDGLLASAAPTEAVFMQTLDHNDYQEPPVFWEQHYQYNETFHTQGGPVFLLLGGEGPASPIWLAAATAPMVYAQEHGAAVYQLEHRFYGASQPFDDLSTEHLQYLTSQQALADAKEFVEKVILPKFGEATKVISFGGDHLY